MHIIFNYIFLLVGALVLAIIGVIIAFLGEKACLSRQCVGQAKFIHRSMDKYVNPCDDFYSFVCANFPQYGTSIIDEIEKVELKRLTQYLGVPADWEEDDRIEHIAKSLYQNCINDTTLELETRPLQRVITRLGGIPFLDPLWDYEMSAGFTIVDNELKHFFNGLNSLFVYNRIIRYKTNPWVHPKNESGIEKKKYLYHVFAVPPHLYHTVAPDPENYLKYCTEINEHFRYDLSTNKNISNKDILQIKAAANFKIKLLKILDKTRNCSREPFRFEEYSIDDFGKITGANDYEEDLITYIKRKSKPGFYHVKYVLTTPTFWKYIADLNNLFKSVSSRVLANYMGVEALFQMTPFLPAKYREVYNKYIRSEAEKNSIVSYRPFQCAKIVKDAMVSTLTAQYLKQNKNPPEGVLVLKSLVYELKEQVKAILKHVKWPTKNDKYKMLALVQNMEIVSPLPPHVIDELLDKTNFDLFNLIMCANDESTLETYLSVRVVRSIRNCQLLNYKTDTGQAFPYTVFHEDYDLWDTAIYYQEDSNEIVVPMGYLFYPSLDSLWPKYLNYGGLAVWIAHRVLKTIGYTNVLYPGRQKRVGDSDDGEGMGQPEPPWFDMGTVHGYEDKRKCTLKDYNEYLKPFRVKCNDANCLEDTLYYAAAVQAAYIAYKRDTEMRFFLEPRIPYLTKYTIDQIFFIKYASSFCQYDGPDYPPIRYKKDKDTAKISANFTVMYGLRNFPKFSEVFKCEKDDKMSKAEPCSVWN